MSTQHTPPDNYKTQPHHTQLLIIGGGINGAGIAADAAGRGLSVRLVEQADLASATSAASSKLIHGGLRYLEHYEFRLVREALAEREILLKKAPHLVTPLRFILPHCQHLRPAWMIQAGLFLYDHLSQRNQLPKSNRVKFNHTLDPLKPDFKTGFEYSDCWVDDARLVVMNAQDALQRGAHIHTYTTCTQAHFADGCWHASLADSIGNQTIQVTADILINATGPWAQKFIETQLERPSPKQVRLIKGSHLVMPQAYQSDKAYILQNEDRRIVFVIPYLEKFTIIGTTDKEFVGNPRALTIDHDEIDYLLNVYNKHFKTQMSTADIVTHYAGVRPLCDDESSDPSAMTRDYTLDLELVDDSNQAGPLLNIFGGKITTYRKLAEATLKKLMPYLPPTGAAWTAYAPLPGGDIAPDTLESELADAYPWLPAPIRKRWIYSFGSLTRRLLTDCTTLTDLGQRFGPDLTEREVIYLIEHEWARTSEDILMRRTKIGLSISPSDKIALDKFIEDYCQTKRTRIAVTNPAAKPA